MILHPETIRTDAENYYACPIAGLQIESNAMATGGLLLVKFNRSEWEKVERRYVFKDWYADYYQVNPVFVYQPFDEANEQDVIAKTDLAISRLISALRLYKHGAVLDPVYTVRFLVKGAMYYREVGPFRTEYLAYPLDGFTYTLSNDEGEGVERIYAVLAKIDETPDTDLAKNLVNNFNLSFLPAMQPAFKLNTLFTGIEMLYGSLDPEVCTDSTMYTRALAMLCTEYNLPQDDDWRVFYTKHVRELRNLIHHNKKGTFPVLFEQAIIYLREALRFGIRLLMRLYLLKADGRLEAVYATLGKAYAPKEILNLSLERFSADDNSLLEQILAS